MISVRSYFGNAVSRRDFRVQLRGSRSAVLLGVYLVLLILIALLVYDSAQHGTGVTLASAQSALQGFYAAIMGTVKVAAILIATATGAASIVFERQRRQLELVQMTAISPRYLLVGKLLSAFRFTWMVLVLSLPVTAACVVLGGATWREVLISYVMISMHALFAAAVELAISAHSPKPTSAVAASLAFVGIVGFLTTPLVASGFMGRMGGMGGPITVPFSYLLSPAASVLPTGMDSSTEWFGVNVPNWYLASLVILFLVRYILHVAAMGITHRGPKELRAFRLDSLFVYAVAQGVLGYTTVSLGSAMSGVALRGSAITGTLAFPVLFLVAISISAFGVDGFRYQRQDGLFRPARVFSGTPSGAAPYILLLAAVGFLAFLLGQRGFGVSGSWIGTRGHDSFMAAARVTLYSLLASYVAWALARLFSLSVAIKSAGGIALAFSAVYFLLPISLVYNNDRAVAEAMMEVWPLRPLSYGDVRAEILAIHFAILLTIGTLILLLAETRRRREAALPPKLARA